MSTIEGTKPREVVMTLTDYNSNKYLWTFKQNQDGDYKLSTNGQAYGNFQCNVDKYEIEWLADEGKWSEVEREVNRGVKNVYKIKSR
tara:strand:- start:257 stop:517 length:261 start_codon:yes stop_codon:yes gene_type:complete